MNRLSVWGKNSKEGEGKGGREPVDKHLRPLFRPLLIIPLPSFPLDQRPVHRLKKKVYTEGFAKQDKTTLRKFAKKFEYDSKLEFLFYVAKKKDDTVLRQLVITEEEKARVLEECHSAPFPGHAS